MKGIVGGARYAQLKGRGLSNRCANFMAGRGRGSTGYLLYDRKGIYFRPTRLAVQGTDFMAGRGYILGRLAWQYRVLTLWRGGGIF